MRVYGKAVVNICGFMVMREWRCAGLTHAGAKMCGSKGIWLWSCAGDMRA